MNVGPRLIAGLCAWLAKGTAVVVAQVQTNTPISTTVCELVQHPHRFNGKLVKVRATVRAGFELSVLYDRNCEKNELWNGTDDHARRTSMQIAYLGNEADLQHPDLLKWKPIPELRPIKLRDDEPYQTLGKHIDQYYSDDFCTAFKCPKFSVTATFIGRFDYDDQKLRAFRNTSTGEVWPSKGGFGHMNISPTQLVWQSVSDVVATPIERSYYLKSK